jgi:hypothetical protein
MKKPELSIPEGGETPPHAAAGKGLDKFPNLATCLTASSWEDGSAKPGGLLIVKPYQGSWRATLKLDGADVVLRAESSEYNGILPALEALLSASVVPWEPDLYGAKKAKKK